MSGGDPLGTVAGVVAYALTKPGAWLDHPWDENHDAVKVGNKIFVGAGADQAEPLFSIKHADLEARDLWRSRLPDALTDTPYLRNKPWSRVHLSPAIDPDDVCELVDESYSAVVAKLPKRDRPEGWDA